MNTSKNSIPLVPLRISCTTCSAAAFAAAFLSLALARAQNIEEIYFNNITSSESTYLNNPSNWYLDAEKSRPFDGALSGANYGKYDAYVSSVHGQRPVLTATLDNVTDLRNFNYFISEIYGYSDILVLGGSKTLSTYGDWNLNLKLNAYARKENFQNVKLWDYAKIQIGGDWIINVDNNGSSGWFGLNILDGYDDRFGSFSVKGNLVLNSAQDKQIVFYTSNNSFTVEGAIDLNGNSWGVFRNSDPSTAGSLMRAIGGLGDADGNGKGNGKLYIMNNKRDSEANLIFTNSKTYEFVGAFQASANSGYKADLNISMIANDAKNGRQILRFSALGTSWPDNFTVTDANINDVIVSNGRLDIGMHDAMKGGNLSLEGYSGNASDAVFSATGIFSGEEIGEVRFDSMTFSGGTILFDISEIENDFISISGGISKFSESSKIVFDINISKQDLQIYLEALETDMKEWDLMSFKTDESDFAISDIVLQTQTGIEGKLDFLEDVNSGLTTVRLSLGIVPEPAVAAAIFGALALACAARRSKR